MVLLAFSLQDQIDKYGTYVGIAAFFGLAVLTLLYFAQAREVKRLREWAGRAPERAAELELAVAEHAEEVRRVPATPVPASQPAPAAVPVVAQQLSQTAPATNGLVKLKPAEVAALAFARSAGVHEPHVPKAHPEPVAVAVAAPPTEATVAAPPTEAPRPAEGVNGGGHPPVPKPATPAARRVEPPPPPPLPPRRVAAAAAAGRRTTSAPPPRESGRRAVIVTAVIGLLVLAGALYGILTLAGNGEDPAPKDNIVATPTPEDSTGGGDDPAATATAAPRVTKDNAKIGVLNATGAPQLAANNKELLTTEGYPEANIDTGNLDQRQASVVLYARGAKSAADGVADVLGITSIKQLADDAQVQAQVEQSATKWDVVAVVGADKN